MCPKLGSWPTHTSWYSHKQSLRHKGLIPKPSRDSGRRAKDLRERGIEPLANRMCLMATIKVTTTPFTLTASPPILVLIPAQAEPVFLGSAQEQPRGAPYAQGASRAHRGSPKRLGAHVRRLVARIYPPRARRSTLAVLPRARENHHDLSAPPCTRFWHL